MGLLQEVSKRLVCHEFLNWVPDKPYLYFLYWTYFGKKLNLKAPKTYNEKLQWLKLYDRKPIYTKMVDKYEAKKYVASIIGEEYIIPTIGVWDNPEDIPFDNLPDKYVLKSTHDSGGIKIIEGKLGKEEQKEIINYFRQRLSHSTYKKQREWPYKDVRPRVLAEKYMVDKGTGELRDYKFFCFDGQVKALFVATDRQSSEKPTAFDFFSADYEWLDIRNGHPNAEYLPEKPAKFELMKQLASKLSMGFPQLRVDLYEIDGRVFFGELTFFHHGGTDAFDPEDWDYTFGEWINLPQKTAR